MWSYLLKFAAPVINLVKQHLSKIVIGLMISLAVALSGVSYLYNNSLRDVAELRVEVKEGVERIEVLEQSIERDRVKHAKLQSEQVKSRSEFGAAKERVNAKKTEAAKTEAKRDVVKFRDEIQAEFDDVVESIRCLTEGGVTCD